MCIVTREINEKPVLIKNMNCRCTIQERLNIFRLVSFLILCYNPIIYIIPIFGAYIDEYIIFSIF